MLTRGPPRRRPRVARCQQHGPAPSWGGPLLSRRMEGQSTVLHVDEAHYLVRGGTRKRRAETAPSIHKIAYAFGGSGALAVPFLDRASPAPGGPSPQEGGEMKLGFIS
jgi:hypothetical protein